VSGRTCRSKGWRSLYARNARLPLMIALVLTAISGLRERFGGATELLRGARRQALPDQAHDLGQHASRYGPAMIRSQTPISCPIGMTRTAASPASAPGRSKSMVRVHAVFSRVCMFAIP
jgi:hypothetical protein